MTDPQTARYIAKNYQSLQGLVMIPIGFLLILVGFGKCFHWKILYWKSPIWPLFIFLTFLFILGSKYFYRRHYGKASPRPWPYKKKWYLDVLKIFLIWVPLYLDLKVSADFPVSLTMLGFAFFFICIPFLEEGRRRYYWGFGALLTVVAFLPMLPIISKSDLRLFGWLTYLSLGVVIVLGGLLDHRFLARNLAPSPEAASTSGL